MRDVGSMVSLTLLHERVAANINMALQTKTIKKSLVKLNTIKQGHEDRLCDQVKKKVLR